MDPKNIQIRDYTYTLPEDQIAWFPIEQRDASRLLIYRDGSINEDIYHNLSIHIPEGALVVFNNTKVLEARILFQKPTGSIIEIFCLEPEAQPDITTAMEQQEKVLWKCLIGGASKWKHGQVLQKIITGQQEDILLEARYIEKKQDHIIIELSWSPPTLSFASVLHEAGAIPLPPYIKREASQNDEERYQTIYARYLGSVAAPTAGLHFTDSVMNSFKSKNISHDFVTLHVGAGTFKPVKSETLGDHEMHAEYFQVSAVLIRQLAGAEVKTVIAVGTTTLRTLESLYWLGVKVWNNKNIAAEELILDQWEATALNRLSVPVKESLYALLKWMEDRELETFFSKTQLIITPGYQVKMADALITNFHQPQSTLLLIVAAIAGDDWKKIYEYALENKFRFLSYGDGSLVWIKR